MRTIIYALMHKNFTEPTDKTYQPLQVGAATHPDLGYLRDDMGENISKLNCYYSELTGLYWIWKNVDDLDIVGVCHYRRYLVNEKEYILTKAEIEAALKDYDILTSKRLDLNFSYYYGFGENHSREDLEKTMAVIKELCPDFYELFFKRVHENHTYFGNIMYCRKALFDEYCSFLFPIFERLHGQIDLDSYDDYHRRLYGFISEFILYVWCEYRGLKVKEYKVGIIGEKKETKETKEALYRLIHENKIEEAKAYFLATREKRPDILMEASDISGELHLLLQVISICEFEKINLEKIHAPISQSYDRLIAWVNGLNKAVTEGALEAFCKENPDTSQQAIDIATTLMKAKKNHICV